MRSFIVLSILLIFIGISCQKENKPLPVAEFSYTYLNQCGVPSQITFQNLSLHANIYRWDFGDSTPPEFSQNPTHTFYHEGIYKVTLTSYGNGGMHSEQKWIYVVQSPVINFHVSDTVANVCDTIHFFADVLTGVLPNAWLWTFGDGTTSTLQNPIHVYTSPGTYDVSLTAINACGSTYVEKKKIIKINTIGSAPIADFTANNLTIYAGQSINFTDLSVNNPTSWQWSFPGAIPNQSTLQHPSSVTYPAPGVYNVSLTVGNAFGSHTTTKQAYIHVLAANPTSCSIKRITVKQIPFPSMPPFVNIFYKITDVTNTTYLNGINQIIYNIYPYNLPVSFIINPLYTFPVFNKMYRIALYDRKQMNDYLIGFTEFNPANYPGYPSVINLSQNGINVEIEVVWQ